MWRIPPTANRSNHSCNALAGIIFENPSQTSRKSEESRTTMTFEIYFSSVDRSALHLQLDNSSAGSSKYPSKIINFIKHHLRWQMRMETIALLLINCCFTAMWYRSYRSLSNGKKTRRASTLVIGWRATCRCRCPGDDVHLLARSPAAASPLGPDD